MSLVRNTFVQASLTLGSRVLGFARDVFLASRFGQGPYMDAFTTALMFPNLFRRLFAEGAFAQAFVPVYGKERTEHGEDEANRLASEAMSFLMFVVVLFCIALQVAMPWLMPLLLSAYVDDPHVLGLATLMTQITMPYLACMTLASLLSGVLNTSGRFALSAGVPVLLNLCTIAPLLLPLEKPVAAFWIAVSIAFAGLAQAGLLWWGVRRLGIRLRFHLPRATAAVRRVLLLAIPGALAGGATQINSLVSQVLTGADEGARSVLYNSDRLYQLPLGLIGVAIGLALVPRLTRQYAAKEEGAAQASMDDAIGLSMALTLPAAAAFLIAPFFIMDATMTRNEFTSDDARRTAEVLRHFAWGVPAFVLAKVLTPPFFARHDTRTPMHFAVASVIVSTLMGASLFFWLPTMGVDGVIGLAIATSFAGWLNVLLLAGKLARDGVYRLGGAAGARMVRILGACGVMSLYVAWCAWNYERLMDWLAYKEIAVVAVALSGFALYCAAALAVRAVSPREIRGALRRERAAPSAPGEGGALPPSLDG